MMILIHSGYARIQATHGDRMSRPEKRLEFCLASSITTLLVGIPFECLTAAAL